MKDMNGVKVIGVDNGYGNTKTANHCFRTGILSYDAEPLFTREMLVYEGRTTSSARATRNSSAKRPGTMNSIS